MKDKKWKPRKGSLVGYRSFHSLTITKYLGTYSNGPRDTYAKLANGDNGIPIDCLIKSPVKSI